MEKLDNGYYKYVLPYPYEMAGAYGNVIFNNGSGQQFDAGAIHQGEKMLYTADGKWIPFEEPKTGTMGDVNLDGTVNVQDATMMQRATVQLDTLSDWQKTLADVDGDGSVTIMDVTCVQRYIAEFSGEYGATGNAVSA